MEDKIQVFQNEQFGEIRTVNYNGEPWFVAKDVCDILGISNPTDALNKGLEDFERARFNLGRQGEANIISESGFYTLVLRSRKSIAKPFRLWVTQEVLPQIRKTGGYIPTTINAVPMTDEQIMAQALIIAQKTIETRNQEIAAAKQAIAQKDCELVKANDKINIMEPKADYYDTVLRAEGLITISCIADDYGISGKAMNQLLHEWGIQYKRGKKWYLYDKYKGLGYIGNSTYDGTHTDGTPATFTNMMWTELGRKFIHGEMKSHGYLTVAEQAGQVLSAATCQQI